MNTKTIILRRENTYCIIQGMRHVAPKNFLQRMNRDLEQFHNQDYQIILEGVSGRKNFEPFPDLTRNRIGHFMDKILSLYPHLAKWEKNELQINMHGHYKSSICADFTFKELVHRMYIRGFRVSKLMMYMVYLKLPKEKPSEMPIFVRIILAPILLLVLRKAFQVINHDRNSLVVEAVEKHCTYSDKSIYIQYGNGHLKGITKKLRKNGWLIERTEIISLQ